MTDKELIKQATDRFKLAAEAERKIRDEALEDMRFRAGEQWPDQVRAARDMDKRPCLTINKLPQFIKQITNEQRQNKPQIQVNAISNGASEETAEVIQGMTRHIEVASDADVAYDTAFDHAVTMGFGYFRLLTDYEDEDSFDQVLKVARVRNPFMVYFDPSCQQPDYSDAKWAFVVEDLTLEEYKEQYKQSDLTTGLQNFQSVGDQAPGWLTKDSVRVAEYFYIDCEYKTLCKLADGSTGYLDELPEGAHVISQRETEVKTVKWCKINAIEVLEKRDWAGKWIPIIPVLGDEIDLNGEKQLVGLVRYARDPMRMYNYWVSAETEMVALQPRAPFIGAEGQFEGHEDTWKVANNRNLAYLEYKPKANAPGPPQRQPYEAPIQAISAAIIQADNDVKSVTGLYNASLGAPGPEQSGKAILARQREGNQANLNFSDNLARSIKHLGRMIVDLIPKIYDAERVIRIIGADQQPKTVTINAPHVDKLGVARLFDVTAGKYDVSVSVGPSYETQRQEAVESIMSLAQADPQIVPVIGDILVRNMDWPGAQEIADRLQQMLPAGLQPNGVQAQQQQMAQLQQQNQMLQQNLQKAMQIIQTKQMELESRERIAAMHNQTTLVKTGAELHHKAGEAMLDAEVTGISQRMQMLHENNQIGFQADQQAQQPQQTPNANK